MKDIQTGMEGSQARASIFEEYQYHANLYARHPSVREFLLPNANGWHWSDPAATKAFNSTQFDPLPQPPSESAGKVPNVKQDIIGARTIKGIAGWLNKHVVRSAQVCVLAACASVALQNNSLVVGAGFTSLIPFVGGKSAKPAPSMWDDVVSLAKMNSFGLSVGINSTTPDEQNKYSGSACLFVEAGGIMGPPSALGTALWR